MIIKSINIIAFGGLKDKVINLNSGINIIYGENEAGKSTIQAFIKIWLYGMSNYKGKDYKQNERLKYMPITGETISGELCVEFRNHEYIIRRTFGKSKKEDTSYIIDAIGGEEISHISKEEPGKYFFNINRATFVNTLFIGQLGVEVRKDKEEEIIDKISNSIGMEEGQVSADVAILKLNKYKKTISNIRKNGTLDLLNEKYSNLLSERYEAYNLSNHNLENEELLINLNDEKNNLNNEINNLDIYKKFLKKTKLQKEYQEITEYFKKKQELKNKEKYINKLLTYNNEEINYGFINELREEYALYLSILDTSKEEKDRIRIKEEKINLLKSPLDKYDYVEQLPKNILNILEKLKIRREVLKEKVDINKSIENEIEFLNLKQQEAKDIIGNSVSISKFREEIGTLLNTYEEKLKELKYLVEDNTELRKNNIFYLSLLVISIMSIIFAILLKNKILSIIMLIIFFGTTSILLINIYVNKSFKNHNKKVEVIKRNINQIENDLNYYCKELQINDYKELFKKLKIYDDYRKLEVKINEKIKDKLLQKKLLDLDKAINEYEIINKDINRYLTISRVDNLEKLINDVNKYEESYKGLDILEIEMKNLKIGLERIIEQLEIREQKIKAKLKIIGFENIDLLEVEDILNELEEKLKLREEINKSLASVEETYSVLTKGKNIDLIKKELADVININFKYSYENEEEIDSVIKQKNLRLLSVEKKIKDVENEIKNRFNGKRTIPDIEEEIKFVEGKIIKNEKQFEATKIALNVLEESYQEIRKSFGPTLNKNVIDSFSKFTDGKYNDVMVADNYEMKVRNKNNIFQAETLSNGANDQLNLSLRLAFIEMIFKSKEISIYLDDAFVQYDDKRTERTIKHLVSENFKQCIIFTCQNREENIVRKGNIKYKYIKLTL
ncbi:MULTISPECIES: AAA family ATPase [unclassified Clostridium]|uniref:AAA family ATPase n=1 Tax=unclassified Clostridium TaxID=2614128 RepID=UPI001C8CBDE4|nr:MULTISPECIES: AAA family ATPase [unclassified Clostridium]MBX9136563.1 AAA family ATPase [Clostridium sp. K12(2020)]MBX9142956.1 AAA family ATPase [Clostridium sp. K13]MDU2289909.1 AAA family ATPase [Clostridium celatum]